MNVGKRIQARRKELNISLDAEIKNDYLKRIIDTIEFSRENNSEFILDINLH